MTLKSPCWDVQAVVTLPPPLLRAQTPETQDWGTQGRSVHLTLTPAAAGQEAPRPGATARPHAAPSRPDSLREIRQRGTRRLPTDRRAWWGLPPTDCREGSRVPTSKLGAEKERKSGLRSPGQLACSPPCWRVLRIISAPHALSRRRGRAGWKQQMSA